MPTVFENLSERFYTSYFEADTEKRREAIEDWITSSVSVIQAEIEADIYVAKKK